MNKRTIAAITTPIGEGGISVIQVSGPDSVEIVNKIFRGKGIRDLTQAEEGRLYYGNILEKGAPVDEVIVNVVRQNASFTGQDLVEINCHGGIHTTCKVLTCVKAAGAVEVDWQEFFDQSLHNNKIDSIQREALLEIPRAKTTLALKVFLDQYNGALSRAINKVRTDGLGHELLLKTAEFGIALSVPKRITIVGSPNAGKSTLINALLGKERVIVHSEPGTTRDAVTDFFAVEGVPFELTDTAGIRETDNVVEGIAIKETLRRLSDADIVVIVFDNSRPLNAEEIGIIKSLGIPPIPPFSKGGKGGFDVQIIPVVNKIDLPAALNIAELQSHFSQLVCTVSAKNCEGISEFSYRFVEKFAEYINYIPGRPIVFTRRQQELLLNAASQDASCGKINPFEKWLSSRNSIQRTHGSPFVGRAAF